MLTRITDIDWDTDGETVELPTELEIDAAAEGIGDPALEVADWLSDRYGWCVNSFNIEPSVEQEASAAFKPR